METTTNNTITNDLESDANAVTITIVDNAAEAKSLAELFGPVIYAYTRAMALADGVLVDVTTLARRYGFRCPVAITEAIYNKLGMGRSDSAREFLIKSLLFEYNRAIFNQRPNDDRVYFDFQVNEETVKLWARIHGGDDGEMVMTVMFVGED